MISSDKFITCITNMIIKVYIFLSFLFPVSFPQADPHTITDLLYVIIDVSFVEFHMMELYDM